MGGNSADRHWQNKALETWEVTQLTDIGRTRHLIMGGNSADRHWQNKALDNGR